MCSGISACVVSILSLSISCVLSFSLSFFLFFCSCCCLPVSFFFFFFSSRRRHTRCLSDWSSDVCSSDLRSVEHIPRRPTRDAVRWTGPSPPQRFALRTCAARPSSSESYETEVDSSLSLLTTAHKYRGNLVARSEERRVGKESTTRW